MLWTNADRCGLDTRKTYKPTVIEYKRPRGRPPKLLVEVLECKRRPDWYWHDFVSSDECQAGDRFHEDWSRSGLRPVQTQQFRQGDCGSQASSSSMDWSADDYDDHGGEDQEDLSGGSTRPRSDGEPKRDAVDSDDAVDRIEQALAGAEDEPSPTRRHPKPVARPAGLSETEVARMIEQFLGGGGVVRVYDERGKLLEHRDGNGRTLAEFGKPKRVKRKRPNMASGAKRGMQALVDPADCTQWPVDDAAGRHRLEHRWAREMLDRDEQELVEAVVFQGEQTTDVFTLRTALSKLSVHYRRHDYEAYVEDCLAVERRKAGTWLTSRGLCL